MHCFLSLSIGTVEATCAFLVCGQVLAGAAGLKSPSVLTQLMQVSQVTFTVIWFESVNGEACCVQVHSFAFMP